MEWIENKEKENSHEAIGSVERKVSGKRVKGLGSREGEKEKRKLLCYLKVEREWKQIRLQKNEKRIETPTWTTTPITTWNERGLTVTAGFF